MDHYGTTYVFVSALDSSSNPVLLWASNNSSAFSGSTTPAAMSGSGLSPAAMPSAYEHHPGVDDYTVYVSAAETVNTSSTNYIDWWHSSTDTASTDFSFLTSGRQEFNTGTTHDYPLTGCSFGVAPSSVFQITCQAHGNSSFYYIGIDLHDFDSTSTWSSAGSAPTTTDTLGRLSILITDLSTTAAYGLLPGDYTSGGDNYVEYWGFGMTGFVGPTALEGY